MRKQHVLFCTLSFSPTVTRRATRSSTEAKTTVTCFLKRLVLTLRRFNYGKRWHEIRVLDRCSTWEPRESEKKSDVMLWIVRRIHSKNRLYTRDWPLEIINKNYTLLYRSVESRFISFDSRLHAFGLNTLSELKKLLPEYIFCRQNFNL